MTEVTLTPKPIRILVDSNNPDVAEELARQFMQSHCQIAAYFHSDFTKAETAKSQIKVPPGLILITNGVICIINHPEDNPNG